MESSLKISSVALAVGLLFANAGHAELPKGGKIVGGAGSISSTGTTMTVTQTTERMAADWQSFSIGKGHTVNFVQPNSNSVALNRVLGSDVSVIQGALNANGKLFLINPNGVLFTKDSHVNVGSLVASTLNITTENFMAGNYRFEGASSNAIVNQGNITAHGDGAGGGTVALIAAKIVNQGAITAHRGNVLMGAGSRVTLNLGGPVSIEVEQGALDALIEQGGAIKADGGLVYLTAKAAGDLASSVINHTGITEAQSLSANQAGKIVLQSSYAVIHTGTLDASGAVGGQVTLQTHNLLDAGQTRVNGESIGGDIHINASGRVLQTTAARLSADSSSGTGGTIRIEAGESAWLSGSASVTGRQGGDISLTAPELTLTETLLDASGSDAGGRIRVGGGWQGKDADLANALRTRLVAAELNVSATQNGNGGTAVIWSENETLFGGHIAARGGAQGGNGGQVEVSSHDQLGFGGLVDASAPQGENGRLLLDPKNLEIVASVSGIDVLSLKEPTPSKDEILGGAGYLIELVNNGVSLNRVVVASPKDDLIADDAGAVYVYDSLTGKLLDTLTGTGKFDQVGTGLTALSNGNFVVRSPFWGNNRSFMNTGIGAVTWVSGTLLFSEGKALSELNSLVGVGSGDRVGSGGVTALTNGHYVVISPLWTNDGLTSGTRTNTGYGAVTWGDGSTGVKGPVSDGNSSVGNSANDEVGSGGVTALTNGNYVVRSPKWDLVNGGTKTADVGAVTWGDGTKMISGEVSSSNSLVGSSANDQVGSGGVTALTNGNYVVRSPNWDLKVDTTTTANVGAVTWGDGSTGIKDLVSRDNSLIGSLTNDQVGSGGVTALTNGHYVVISPLWTNDGLTSGTRTNTGYGAVTWGDGTKMISGEVSSSNSLVGSSANDEVGSGGVTALTNGNYVVRSPKWDLVNGGTKTADVGAVTWGDGSTGIKDLVTRDNSLIGSLTNDQVGSGGVTALTNGHYVVISPLWTNDGLTSGTRTNTGYGAVTWGNGTKITSGVVSSSNSLVGSSANDQVGSGGVTALTNGSYVVRSPWWDLVNSGTTTTNVGALTWNSGADKTTGLLDSKNSFVGSSTADRFGNGVIIELKDGRLLVGSTAWREGSFTNAGRVDILSFTNTGVSDNLPLIYSIDPGANSKLLASILLASLNAGSVVTLQANNDITLSTALTVNSGSGNGGNLVLQAGRSLFLNANITTDNGDLTLIANDTAANGVVNAYRDAGAAVITQAAGTSINAGTGRVTIDLRNGSGNTNNTVGAITLASITAADLSVQSSGFSASATAANKAANGTTAAVISDGSVSGLAFQSGSNLSVVVPTTGDFASSTAGTGIAVTTDPFKIKGYNGGNSSNLLKQGSAVRASTTADITAAQGGTSSGGAGDTGGGTGGGEVETNDSRQNAVKSATNEVSKAATQNQMVSSSRQESGQVIVRTDSPPSLAQQTARIAQSGGLKLVQVDQEPDVTGNNSAAGRDPGGFMRVFAVRGGVNVPQVEVTQICAAGAECK